MCVCVRVQVHVRAGVCVCVRVLDVAHCGSCIVQATYTPLHRMTACILEITYMYMYMYRYDHIIT